MSSFVPDSAVIIVAVSSFAGLGTLIRTALKELTAPGLEPMLSLVPNLGILFVFLYQYFKLN